MVNTNENQELRNKLNKLRKSDLLLPANLIPIAGPYIYGKARGYEIGKELGRPKLGFTLGAEGTIGALSNKDENIKVKDIYTYGNVLRNGAMIIPTALGADYLINDNSDTSMLQKGAIYGTLGMGIMPAARFYLGKGIGNYMQNKKELRNVK